MDTPDRPLPEGYYTGGPHSCNPTQHFHFYQVTNERGSRSVFLNRAADDSGQINSITGTNQPVAARRPSESESPPESPFPPDQAVTAGANFPEIQGSADVPLCSHRLETVGHSQSHCAALSYEDNTDVSDQTTQSSDPNIPYSYPASLSGDDSDAMPRNQRPLSTGQGPGDSNITVERDEFVDATFDIGYLKPGDVFTIMQEAGQITSMTFIVMARTEKGPLACVSLCRHGGYKPDPNDEFLAHHCKVHDGRNLKEINHHPRPERHVMIRFSNEETTRFKKDCWTDCQQVFTISKVGFRRDGVVEQFPEFLTEFMKIQKKMYKPGE